MLTDLKSRGLQDILITASTQICVVHQICNSMRYVVWKDRKEFTRDMKDIYGAPTREAAAAALNDFEQKWAGKL